MLESFDRRTFLRRATRALLLTGGATGVFIAANVVSGVVQQRIRPSSPEATQGVGAYAADLLTRSARIVGYDEGSDLMGIVGEFAAGALFVEATFGSGRNVRKSAFGAGAALAGKGFDLSSTADAASVMADPRFREYGFDRYVSENSVLSSRTPTSRDIALQGSLSTAFLAFGGTILPVFGSGYLFASEAIARHNEQVAAYVTTAMDLGDRVAGYLRMGLDDHEIRAMIPKLVPSNG